MSTFTLILRRLSPIIIIIVAILGASALMATKQEPEKKSEESKPPVVNVMAVVPQSYTLDLSSYGVAAPKNKTQLVSEVQGRILSIADEFVAGGVVTKGQALAVIEPSDYEADLMQAQASLAQAQAALNEEIARGQVAKIEFKDFDNGLPPELGLRIPQLKKEQANVKSAQAALKRAERNLERTTIRAPFDGLVRSRQVDLGQYVTLGNMLGELYDTSVAEIRLPLANEELAYLASMDSPDTQVALRANLAGQAVVWNGQIVRSEGIIDPENRMVYLVAEVADPYQRGHDNPQGVPLKFGTFVNASITGRQVTGIVKLPRHLLKNQTIALVNDDNTIEMRDVNVVRQDLDSIYIKDSLRAGERVSMTLLNDMNDGLLVTVAEDAEKGSKQPTTNPSSIAVAVEH
ncbi:efflux RND transporter periplasmic adaptor subunit [Shewanella sp. NIFS-20-20]|uniref:efflux RND transporter periplasmic adaptor subunit n=1 Tax=Shewanella sp. NIFS-20-20 TaxID=2853806 RepID=UPI002108F88B|nr:efflux RND transporter periplasmic adaptor subunit [Shewanella sp. NIFS-20-20]